MISGLFLFTVALVQPAEMPAALRNALENRSLNTLDVEYVRSVPSDPRGGRNWRSRYVHGDVLEEFLGDANGFVDLPERAGKPFACSPQIALYSATSGEMWSYLAGDQRTRVVPLYEWPSTMLGRVDPRAFGMTARSQTSDDLESLTFASKTKTPDVEYTSYSTRDLPGGLIEVTGHLPAFEFDHRWVLDPAKACNPVRCEIWEKGVLAQFSETELGQYADGTWFPAKTDFYTDGRLVETVEVLRARINDPADNEPLTPADMGLCDGVVIHRGPNNPDVIGETEDGGRIIKVAVTRWANGQELSRAEFAEAVRAGLLSDNEYYRRGRDLASEDGGGRFPVSISSLEALEAVGNGRDPKLWEQYTRSFIRVHKLSPRPTRRAWQVLSEAQSHAYEYLDDKQLTLREMRSFWHRQPTTQPSGDADAEKHHQYAQATERLERIFARELRPQLERMAADEENRSK